LSTKLDYSLRDIYDRAADGILTVYGVFWTWIIPEILMLTY